jgi:hypothetical protein
VYMTGFPRRTLAIGDKIPALASDDAIVGSMFLKLEATHQESLSFFYRYWRSEVASKALPTQEKRREAGDTDSPADLPILLRKYLFQTRQLLSPVEVVCMLIWPIVSEYSFAKTLKCPMRTECAMKHCGL